MSILSSTSAGARSLAIPVENMFYYMCMVNHYISNKTIPCTIYRDESIITFDVKFRVNWKENFRISDGIVNCEIFLGTSEENALRSKLVHECITKMSFDVDVDGYIKSKMNDYFCDIIHKEMCKKIREKLKVYNITSKEILNIYIKDIDDYPGIITRALDKEFMQNLNIAHNETKYYPERNNFEQYKIYSEKYNRILL